MKLIKINPLQGALSLLCCALAIVMLASCMQEVYDSNKQDDGTKPNSFTFATTSTIQLNVKYDISSIKGDYQILFEVYLENPYTTDEDGQLVKRTDIEPVLKRMTDGSGMYSGKETITADHGDEAYIYTSNIGVPGLFKTTINNGTIDADITIENINKSITQTRAYTLADAPQGYETLGTWDKIGYPNYLNTEGKLELSASLLKTIKNTLPEGGNCPQKYRQSIDFEINDEKGRSAEVFLRFIGGTSGAANTFGYYCYKSGASEAEIQKAKKYIIFPNTITTPGYNKPIALKGGESVKLHYIDENGVDQGTTFPNGVRIGWFILNDAFMNGSGKAFYSTTALNSDGRTHTAAFRIGEFIVLSFEDWADQDYNDVQFNVWSNPIEAIAPDVPEVKPGEDDDAYTVTYKGIVAYEDNWPHQGDYDLNDVIVKYNSVLTYNAKNQVLSTEDNFTLLWSGARYKDGFAYQLNTNRSNVVTEFIENPTPFSGQGLDADLSLATINLFLDARNTTNDNRQTITYKIKNTFNNPVDHNTFGVAPYNPFVIVHDKLESPRTEVHLVNHKPTDKADPSLFHYGKDLSVPNQGIYYIAAENYPFAIHLIDAEEYSTTEMKPIDESFPNFTKWVQSNGTEYKDWYK